jgi:hypothetical protein
MDHLKAEAIRMKDESAPAKWQKGGPSPNPGGRPRQTGDVRELAKKYTAEAVETLAKIMRSEEAPPAARTAAASALLDRAYGRPAQAVDAMVTVQHSLSDQAVEVLRELSERAKARKALERPTIDVTPNGHAGPLGF